MTTFIQHQVIQEQEQPSTNQVKEFGHFVNATLLQETRSFIIATLRGKVIAMEQYRNTNGKSNWKSR